MIHLKHKVIKIYNLIELVNDSLLFSIWVAIEFNLGYLA